MGLLMVRVHPTPFGLWLAPANAGATCANLPDSLVEPTRVHTSTRPPKRKSPHKAGFLFGVADGVRTHDNWNHNPGLYR